MRHLLPVVLFLAGLGYLSDDAPGQVIKPQQNNKNNYAPRPVLRPHHYDVTVADTVKVRTMIVPNDKKYTAEELKKLKGDTPEEQRLAGYKATMEELKPGDLVQIILGQPKTSKTDKGETVTFVPAGQVQGSLVKSDGTKVTVKVNEPELVRPGQQPSKENKDKPTPIKPTEKQATMIVLVAHPPMAAGKDK